MDFDSLDENTVDTVVSLALAEVDETPADSLAVVLLCVRVLGADGQFARLALLADRLRSLGRRFRLERPYLALATESFAQVLKSQERAAMHGLDARLGLSDGRLPTTSRTREQLNDLLAAATLRDLLSRDGVDRAFPEAARLAAMSVGDGLLLAFIDAAATWQGAAARARPERVLAEIDPTFASERMQDYIARRRVQVLYPAQIRALVAGATLDEDCVVSLPTSSGKTLLAEFRIAATLSRHPNGRAIYVAPYRLLARQVENTFRPGLGRLGFSTRDLGSGYDPELGLGAGVLPDVAVCTPERLDALMRAAGSDSPSGAKAAELFATAKVLVFDELQLIGRPMRGPRFELVLARLRLRYPNLRLLGLSAASQGADDVAQWLTGRDAVTGARRPTGTLEIVWEVDGDLKQRVLPRPTTVGHLPRTKAIDDAAALILQLKDRYRPVLAVETSRPQAESLANKIVRTAPQAAADWRESLTEAGTESLQVAIEEVQALLGSDHPLARCMGAGVAFHHAGVPTHALQQIERLATAGVLRVVCSTTTVAEGADLPFRVVVIPHLNFAGASGHLERDLYMNIIGRAGRANVSVEGIVFILDSDARTLRNLVRASLWSNTTADRIRGRLAEVATEPRTVEDWNAYNDVQSQVMGWLGDGNSYTPDQPAALAAQTFTWETGTGRDRAAVVGLVSHALNDLEERGYALAASPYQLTDRGRRARLTGLGAASVARLERAVERGRDGWLLDLVATTTVTEVAAAQIAALLFEGIEVAEHSFWLRRVSSSPAGRLQALLAYAQGDGQVFHDSPHYETDLDLLSSWLLGNTYRDLAARAPVLERANALFGGGDVPKRTSDATEYIGKLTYRASWVWSGIRVIAGGLGDALPYFLRQCIEFGLPTESACQLATRGFLTRPAALAISEMTGPSWSATAEWVINHADEDAADLGLTTTDSRRLADLRARLRTPSEAETA